MSKSEKRSFNRYAKMTSGEFGSLYLKLFGVLAELVVFDQDKVVKAMQVSPERLSSIQNKLQKLVLKSMRTVYDDKEIDQKLFAAIADIDFLFKKNMTGLAQRRLKKALSLAEAHGKSILILKLLEWDRRLRLESKKHLEVADLSVLKEREGKIHKVIGIRLAMRDLHDQTRALMKKSTILKSMEQHKHFESILENPIMAQKPNDFMSEVYFLDVKSMIATAKGDREGAFRHSQALIKCWEANSGMLAIQPDLFLGNLNNYISIALMQGEKLEVLRAQLRNIHRLAGLRSTTQLKLKRVIFSQELLVTMNLGSYLEGEKLIREIDEWLEKVGLDLAQSRVLLFHFNISSFYFLNGNWAMANKRLQTVLNLPGLSERKDIREFARLLQLVLQVELGNFGLLEYLLRSARRYFQKAANTSEFEGLLLALVGNLLELGMSQEAEATLYEKFKKDVFQVRDNAITNSVALPLGLGEILVWAESKASGLTMRAAFEVHAGRSNTKKSD